ncbi:aminotransferase class V-fold PLP-dependent enzyme [Alloacidobacterium dinghuense]|uniref:Aminotransferase class V-fold PLP-dependent enzyme n=1 Tax=Alloacidobacterium dinghuense TaxID=2763107 RepID=A0A7G8BPL1_9BACT|nr:aminotransferase class V-fold PLP-dependent enzyme [Alloacidobacterium dinghuense]QNI34481.1 aminotransferase class V-fold PLP-dependent enzyme [Alloacidobacterium dinghuense]
MIISQFGDEFETLQAEIARGPIFPCVTPDEIRSYLASRYDFKKTRTLEEVISDVEQMLRTWQVQVTHPRYFGLFNPSVTLASVIADTLVAMYNPQLANWRTSPVANEIERHTLGWLTAKFGLPATTIATFTSGGTEANLSAVVVALTRAFPDYGEHGLRHLAASPAIYLTEEAHNGYNKIAHMTGLGRRALRTVATDRHLKLDLGDLERRVAEDRQNGFSPFMVVGTAGTTAAGIIDPLDEIGRFCREEGLWFHADAAWGGAAIISPKLKHYLSGIDTADSITCDAHKWFSVPMGCGMFFCRHPDRVLEAFRVDISYMPKKTDQTVTDPLMTSVQWSRRFIGLKLFMALAQHGESGQADLIEHQTRMGNVLREALDASGWRIINSTPLPLVCFTRDGLVPARFLATLREQQVAWMSEASIGGAPVLRACITSFRTTEADIHWVVDEMNRLFLQDSGQSMSNQTVAIPVQSTSR